MAWPPSCGPACFRWWKVAAAVAAVALMAQDLGTPVHGSFYFRQAHVAANIELLLENGLSLAPGTYNVDAPYVIFDFPAYQLLVACLSRAASSDPLFTARAVNAAIFLLTVLLIDGILAEAGIGRRHRAFCGFLFCFSPMILFYYRCPFVDPLAIGLSLLSLYGFLRLEKSRGSARLSWLAVLLGAAVLSSIIKNPVYLPVLIAVVLYMVSRRFEPMKPWELSLYTAAVAGAVFGFKSWSNRMNGINGFLAEDELRDYFGPLADRFDPASWSRIGGVLQHDAATLLTLSLAVLGVLLWLVRSRRRAKPLFLALLAGWALTLLVFFNRFTWHNYYFLGLEFPLAFFGAYSLDRAHVLSRAWRRRKRGRRGLLLSASIAVVAISTVLASIAAATRLAATPTEWIRASGQFVQSLTAPDDFVVYVVESEDFRDWNPVFLYFAKRRGINVTTRRIERHAHYLGRLKTRYRRAGSRLLVFCPSRASARLAPFLESAGAQLTEASADGFLYRMSRE